MVAYRRGISQLFGTEGLAESDPLLTAYRLLPADRLLIDVAHA